MSDDLGSRAADALAGAVGVPLGVEHLDPLLLGRSLVGSLLGAARRPRALARVGLRGSASLVQLSAALLRHVAEGSAEPVVAPAEGDRRFAAPAWRENAGFFALQQSYLIAAETLRQLVAAGDLDATTKAKADFAAGLLIDALAPTNLLATNPAALQRAFETGGRSVARGVTNFLGDLAHNGGWPRKVDRSRFELGRNLAATPGSVVYRNELIELIHYDATTEQVHEVPVLLCPPWINRYYIMDLSPGRSLAQWCVEHGLSTFAISYKNPDASMSETTFDDYLERGPMAALDVVRAITGAESVHTVSVCLGGTLTAAMVALLRARGEDKQVRSMTLLNSLIDHEDAGVLSRVFTDAGSIARIEQKMARTGYLDADELSESFDLMRANDLVFRPLVSAWLMGEDPPALDLLAWNAHSTRLPAAMHSFYLRRLWLANDLAHDRLELCGTRLALRDVETDCYIVGAIDDHITPWRSSYRTTQLLGGSCRFVLSSSGHVAGIVNPPGPKTRTWLRDDHPSEPDAWLAGASELQDTWWNDWIGWVLPRSGALRTPPPTGDDHHRPLCPAPGRYVRS